MSLSSQDVEDAVLDVAADVGVLASVIDGQRMVNVSSDLVTTSLKNSTASPGQTLES